MMMIKMVNGIDLRKFLNLKFLILLFLINFNFVSAESIEKPWIGVQFTATTQKFIEFNNWSKLINLKDYLQTIYNLDKLYIETFANDLENFRNNLNDIEFKINDEVNFIIQSKPFFSFSKYLALFILIFFWGVIFFYCLKRNSLSKLWKS